MQRETTTLSDNGTASHVYVWTPNSSQPVHGFVQVFHGLAEHAARYEALAAALCDAGFAVVSHDHRGHGRSCASPDELGFFAARGGWQAVLADAARVGDYAQKRFSGMPWAMFGHSMGALLAIHALAHSGARPAAVMLSGTTGKVGTLLVIGQAFAKLEQLRIGPRGRSKLIDATAFGTYNRQFRPNRTRFDWLSRDPDKVDAYVRDPLCGFSATVSMWRDIFSAQLEMQKPKFLARLPNLPYRVIGGDRDPVGGNGKQVKRMVEMMRGQGLSVELRIWPGGRHEMLNEINGDEVIHESAQWIAARLGT